MVTAPCCKSCHRYWDGEVEYFRNILVAQIDRHAHRVSDHLLEGPVIRSLKRNSQAWKDFFRNARLVELRNRSGIILAYRQAFEMDMSRFSRSISKIVRGLFYKKSHRPLAPGYRVEVAHGDEFWQDEGFQHNLAIMEPWASYGDDVFMLRCARDSSDWNKTAWLLRFYCSIAVYAWTEPDAGAQLMTGG